MAEDVRNLVKRGLISRKALRKAKSKFAKRAGHNPPKPQYAEQAENASSVLETISRPVAAAAGRLGKYLKSDKPAARSATLGIRG